MLKRILLLVFIVAASCHLSEDSQQVEIVGHNDLGVTGIETERFESNGDSVFELRGLSADGEKLAFVRLRTGIIADLLDILPGQDNFGSEIIVAVAGNEQRSVTRETTLFHVSSADPATRRFLALPEVGAALEREANIIAAQPAGEGGEAAYTGISCPATVINVSPTAQQCCYSVYLGNIQTDHVRPADGAEIYRVRNAGGSRCKASGGGACAGAACYWGPNAFGRPNATLRGSSYFRIELVQNPQHCVPVAYGSPQTPIYADQTGSFPNGAGCCVDTTGPCGVAGYPACATCGGGDAGVGAWDY